MKRFLTPDRVGLIIAVFAAITYGFWPTAVRGMYAYGANPVFALIVITWARGLSMGAFCLLTRNRIFATREDIRQGITGGVFQAITVICVYIALTFISGPLMIIIIFSHTIMLLFYMAWRKEIKLDTFTVLITLIALAGLSLVLDLWHKQPVTNLIGILLSFVAALATVTRLYVYGKQTQERHPLVVGAENFLTAALLVSFTALYEMPHAPSIEGWSYVVFGCVAYCAATAAMFYGISLMGSFRWSLYAKMEPIFTSLFSAYFLKEILAPRQYMGVLVVLGSLALYQIVEQRRKITVL